MIKNKRWVIKVNKWFVEHQGVPVVYDTKGEAVKDANDFNSLRSKNDNPYSVEEYKG